ncbi:integrase [Neosynechococcus sphagnicola sy1]|uniref:Integrase n=1 Tax=Neosynechococcus sphagnicola sy1 TaxID=1497020 RepID=A0A098TNS8_9CYAN|nr:site-specific integrase [Neosynechococcus sphagnicola]KGF72488.1 integrase [Neosynechococcus sphagnicola sy1]
MKLCGFGQATPFDEKSFAKVRDNFPNETHRLLFAIAWYSLERWGAILQLQVDDVYLDSRRRTPRKTILFPAPTRKDRKTREVPISKSLALELRAYHPPIAGYLFPSLLRPGMPLSFRAADRALRRALVRCGLANQGFSTHSTRRGGITLLAARGTHPKVIQALTGHSSLATLGRYIDVSEEQKESAVALL